MNTTTYLPTPDIPNPANNVQVNGERSKNMTTVIVQKNEVTTKQKFLFFALSSEDSRKAFKCFLSGSLAGASVYFAPMVGGLGGTLLIGGAILCGKYSFGLFEEINTLQKARIEAAKNLLKSHKEAAKTVGQETSLLSLELAETKTRQYRAALYRDFTEIGETNQKPHYLEIEATEEIQKADQRRARLKKPKIELCQDGFFLAEGENQPRHIQDTIILETTYKNKLLKKEDATDREALERTKWMISEYNRQRNIIANEADEIGGTEIWYKLGDKVMAVSGYKEHITEFATAYSKAKAAKKKLPVPANYQVEFNEIVNFSGINQEDLQKLPEL